MKTLNLIRVEDGPDGMFSIVVFNGKYICFTLECPWKDNTPYISCIPEGTYICQRRDEWFGKKRWGYTYQVNSVEGRTGILFHPANWVVYKGRRYLEGCIAPGTLITKIKGERGVASSTKAFRKLIELIGGNISFRLSIIRVKTGVNET